MQKRSKKELLAEVEKLWPETLTIGTLILGLIDGAIFSLLLGIAHDYYKSVGGFSYQLFVFAAIAMSILLFIFTYKYISHVQRPFNKVVKELRELESSSKK